MLMQILLGYTLCFYILITLQQQNVASAKDTVGDHTETIRVQPADRLPNDHQIQRSCAHSLAIFLIQPVHKF